MKHDYCKFANGFVDSFTFDNGVNITVARHDGIVGRGRFWQAITWDAMNNVIVEPTDLYTYHDVAAYIDVIAVQYGGK